MEIGPCGVWNREAGPDFSNAALRFDDQPGAPVVRGSIELDIHADSWEHHGHGTNPAFDDVVLHLYLQRGTKQPFTRTSQHRQVAQVQLDLRQIDHRPSPFPGLPLAKCGRCQGPLAALNPARINAVLTAAAQYRLETKNRRRRARLRRGTLPVTGRHSGLQGEQAAFCAARATPDAQTAARRRRGLHGPFARVGWVLARK